MSRRGKTCSYTSSHLSPLVLSGFYASIVDIHLKLKNAGKQHLIIHDDLYQLMKEEHILWKACLFSMIGIISHIMASEVGDVIEGRQKHTRDIIDILIRAVSALWMSEIH